MAEYISFQPSDFFNNVIYTGNGTAIGSGGNAITGVGFQSDFTWIKNRDTTDSHMLFDAVRGATNILSSDSNAAESNNTESLTTWGAGGFTLGDKGTVNTNAEDYVSWNWKAGTTTGIAGSPSITPTSYSFNATSGFSIIEYVGNATSGATLPHGLGTADIGMIIVKRSDGTSSWQVFNKALGATKYLQLDTNDAAGTSATRWNDTAPTSTLFSLGNNSDVNGNTDTYIAYVFAEIRGYSKFASYTGTGNVDGAFVYTGFSPAYVCVKKTNGTATWIQSGSGISFNGKGTNNSGILRPDTTGAETDEYSLQRFSNGFGFKGADGGSATVNGSGDTYVYMAFAESPIVSSNDVPAVAQ